MAMTEEDMVFKSWFQVQLSNLLGFPTGEEMINYILAFESAREIKDHLSGLLDPLDSATQPFLEDFFAKWKPRSLDHRVYRKVDGDDNSFTVGKKKNGVRSNSVEISPETSVAEIRSQPKKLLNAIFPEKQEVDDQEESFDVFISSQVSVDTVGSPDESMSQVEIKDGSPFKPKHLTYVPLYSSEGKVRTDIVLLEGRHPCKCLAQKHNLVNNCVQCGRVVCEQEGAGPCMFCGNLVCSEEDREILDRESNKSRKLHKKLMAQTYEENVVDESLLKAIVHKDRLLDFDKNCIKRTKVIDDEADHFSDNRWLPKKKREALAKQERDIRDKKNVSRLDKKFTLDLFGRKVIEDVSDNSDFLDPDNEDVQVVPNPGTPINPNSDIIRENSMLDPRLKVSPPKYESSERGCAKEISTSFTLANEHKQLPGLRLQDGALQEIVDTGVCLSMHQPWASLLVHGIKKIEGRSWYTPHRGRLWIASTAKMPRNDHIRNVENQYRCLYPDEDIEFPKNYPSGALLGCVNVVDCLPNDEYFEKNPDVKEENDSSYLFVCEEPEQLQIMFAVEGKHKTYKLAKYIHDAAKKNLLPSKRL